MFRKHQRVSEWEEEAETRFPILHFKPLLPEKEYTILNNKQHVHLREINVNNNIFHFIFLTLAAWLDDDVRTVLDFRPGFQSGNFLSREAIAIVLQSIKHASYRSSHS